jgi:ankyrin repeat protein
VTSVSSLPVPFICFQNGNTPLDNAAYNGHVDAMRYLVGRGAKCDEKADVSCCMHPCNVCALTCRRGVGVTSVSSLHLFSGWPHSFACCCFEGTCRCHEISGRAWCQV